MATRKELNQQRKLSDVIRRVKLAARQLRRHADLEASNSAETTMTEGEWRSLVSTMRRAATVLDEAETALQDFSL